ncbi:MAG: hypothetical protein IJB59_13430 [Oscillospiraceae bacterium]|nr:hypothetical protein [Oscillospiraceae bacterium]
MKKFIKIVHTAITRAFQMINVTFPAHPFDKPVAEWYSNIAGSPKTPRFQKRFRGDFQQFTGYTYD